VNIDRIVWDMEDDPDGNVRHIAQNGLTVDEVDEVLFAADEVTASYSSGLPLVFGLTSTGKYIAIVFEVIEAVPLAVRPITAYETDP
jgi:hypothetical protein